MKTESSILFEAGSFWVARSSKKGFEVYESGVTHSKRVGIIGYEGEIGLAKAIEVAKKRNKKTK